METSSTPEPEIIHTGSISSDVELDLIHNEAHKVYHPSRLVRLWYWLAFQAPFPYVSNHYALEAARLRRILVDLLTKVWFGHHLVARVIDVTDLPGGGHDFVTTLVRGHEPERTEPAKRFLRELDAHFLEAGLPTWQTTPYNPHAITNFIEANDGTYRIIDLESSLVAFLYPVSRIVRLIRLGQFPSFDDIDIECLQTYITEHSSEIDAKLPPGEREILDSTVALYAEQQSLWHHSERRWVPRALRFAFRLIDVPSWVRGTKRLTTRGQEGTESFVRQGIAGWVSEGRVSRVEADNALDQLQTPAVAYAILHLSAHFAISLPLRYPFGALARFSYTTLLRLRAEVAAAIGRASPARARETHTFLVAMIALIPGFGRLAYLFAKPLRSNRLLVLIPLDSTAKKLPADLYGRLHLRALVDWWASGDPAIARRNRVGGLFRWAAFRPHIVPVALLALTNVLVIAIGMYVDRRLEGDWNWWFAERGLLDTLTATQFILAAVAAALAFRYFWTSNELSGADAAGIFLWLFVAVGLLTFAIDDYFGTHEAIGEVIGAWFEGADNVTEVLVFLGYATAACGALYLFRHEVFAWRPSSILLTLALVASAIAATSAALHDANVTVPAALSNPAIAAGVWLAAAIVRLQEVLSRRLS